MSATTTMTIDMADSRFGWLHTPSLAAILAVLDHDGEEARVVGGAVRGALFGERVIEWDIASTALPGEVKRRAEAKGWRVVPTGIEHGTVTVIVDDDPYEVTTLREDVETDGRHAHVRFGRDFRADAFRRDFTMNALAITPQGRLFDYSTGLDDIAARRVRFIGDARTRIREDYLRILRLFRFEARYGSGRIDDETMRAAIRERDGLTMLSRERIGSELLKLLVQPGARRVVREIAETGFLTALLGGVVRLVPFERLTDIEQRLARPADAVLRLGVLGVFIEEDADRLTDMLRLSNRQSERLSVIAGMQARRLPESDNAVRALLHELGPQGSSDAMLTAFAHDGDARWMDAMSRATSLPTPGFPLRGGDLTARGVPPGPRLGRLLAQAERRWVEAGFPDRDATLAMLDAILADDMS